MERAQVQQQDVVAVRGRRVRLAVRRSARKFGLASTAAALLGACTREDRRAVVGLDQRGDPIYASPEEQARFDREREDRALVQSVADGRRSVQSLSPQEKATLRNAVKGK